MPTLRGVLVALAVLMAAPAASLHLGPSLPAAWAEGVAPAKPMPDFITQKYDIRAIAFSPDGQLLAVAGGASRNLDNTDAAELTLWDPKTRKKVRAFEGHSQWVGAVAFSPDGKTLASASPDKTVRLWDVGTGRQVAVLDDAHWIISLAFSPDGTTLAGADWTTYKYDPDSPRPPGMVMLWDVKTRKLRVKLEGHADSVPQVAFCPDGKMLATISSRLDKESRWYTDGEIKLWDPATGKLKRKLTGPKGSLNVVAFSPDGKTLATACRSKLGNGTEERGEVTVWDLGTGRPTATAVVHNWPVQSLAFSPDGKTLASGSLHIPRDTEDCVGCTGEVVLLNPRTLRRITKLNTGGESLVDALAFSPDSRILATRAGKRVQLWVMAEVR